MFGHSTPGVSEAEIGVWSRSVPWCVGSGIWRGQIQWGGVKGSVGLGSGCGFLWFCFFVILLSCLLYGASTLWSLWFSRSMELFTPWSFLPLQVLGVRFGLVSLLSLRLEGRGGFWKEWPWHGFLSNCRLPVSQMVTIKDECGMWLQLLSIRQWYSTMQYILPLVQKVSAHPLVNILKISQ